MMNCNHSFGFDVDIKFVFKAYGCSYTHHLKPEWLKVL